ncbi:hypothetical protein SMU82_09733, partial [Streptococcus mutans SM6]
MKSLLFKFNFYCSYILLQFGIGNKLDRIPNLFIRERVEDI